MADSDRYLWLLQDKLGTVRDVLNRSGGIVARVEYNAFGVIESVTNASGTPATLPTRYTFTAQEYDPITGNIWFSNGAGRGRWYSPTLNRFLQPDELGFATGDMNLYRYVGNSPTNANDPSGRAILDSDGEIKNDTNETALPDGSFHLYDEDRRWLGKWSPCDNTVSREFGGANDANRYRYRITLSDLKKGLNNGVNESVESLAEWFKKNDFGKDTTLGSKVDELGGTYYRPGFRNGLDETIEETKKQYKSNTYGMALGPLGVSPGARGTGAAGSTGRMADATADAADALADARATAKAKPIAQNGAAVSKAPCAPKATSAPEHHVMTNKNKISTAAGGPYTPKFEALAKRRGITLEDAMNKMRLPGHRGPHPEYNEAVYKRMAEATKGLKGKQYNSAFDKELEAIKQETRRSGTPLNRLATGQ